MSAVNRLYIVDNLRHLTNVREGETSWWCVEPATEAGSLAAIYLKGKGIVLICTVLPQEPPEPSFCRTYELTSAYVHVDVRLSKPITAKEIKAHPVLHNLPAIKRNFQLRSFRLNEPFLSALLEAAKARR